MNLNIQYVLLLRSLLFWNNVEGYHWLRACLSCSHINKSRARNDEANTLLWVGKGKPYNMLC